MTPEPITDDMLTGDAVKRTFVGDDLDGCEPCEALVERHPTQPEVAVVRVPLRFDPGEYERLLRGGTIWVSMYGGLSPFSVVVQEPPAERAQGLVRQLKGH